MSILNESAVKWANKLATLPHTRTPTVAGRVRWAFRARRLSARVANVLTTRENETPSFSEIKQNRVTDTCGFPLRTRSRGKKRDENKRKKRKTDHLDYTGLCPRCPPVRAGMTRRDRTACSHRSQRLDSFLPNQRVRVLVVEGGGGRWKSEGSTWGMTDARRLVGGVEGGGGGMNSLQGEWI